MEISELSCGLKKYYWTHGVRLAMVTLWIEHCLPVHILSILKYWNFNDFSRHHKNVKISLVARTGVFKDSVRCVVCKTCSLWWGPTLSSMLMCKSPVRQLFLLRIINVPDKLVCAEVHALVLPHWEGEEGCEKRPSVNLPDHHAIDWYMKTLYSECVFLFRASLPPESMQRLWRCSLEIFLGNRADREFRVIPWWLGTSIPLRIFLT